jgi:hypothetical protein
MIKKINTGIPTKTNKRIISVLSRINGWSFGYDNDSNQININKPDAGFFLKTYTNYSTYINNDNLNFFGYFVADIIEKNTFFKFKSINRIYWNWYNSGSNMQFHSDESLDKFFSIVYNLHTNDGGTEFSVNDKKTFYNSIESEALFFPSKIKHKGIAPTKDLNRFSLNIVVEI